MELFYSINCRTYDYNLQGRTFPADSVKYFADFQKGLTKKAECQ